MYNDPYVIVCPISFILHHTDINFLPEAAVNLVSRAMGNVNTRKPFAP